MIGGGFFDKESAGTKPGPATQVNPCSNPNFADPGQLRLILAGASCGARRCRLDSLCSRGSELGRHPTYYSHEILLNQPFNANVWLYNHLNVKPAHVGWYNRPGVQALLT